METPNSNNYTLGKGTISFNQKVDGSYLGYRDLGNAPSLSLSIDITKLDHFSSRSGIKSKDKSVVQEVTPTLGFGLDEVTDKNFAMNLLGNNTASSQVEIAAATTVVASVPAVMDVYTDLDHKKIAGLSYITYDAETTPLAQSGTLTGGTSGATATIEAVYAATASGVIVVSGVSGVFENNEALDDGATGDVMSSSGVIEMSAKDVLVLDLSATLVIYESGTDYMVNVFSGELLYKSSGSITAADSLTVAYMVEAATFSTVNMLQTTEIIGSLHFVSDNASGNNYELELWSVTLMPDGELSLIGDDWLVMAFSGEILKDEAGHPAEPYGRLIMDTTE